MGFTAEQERAIYTRDCELLVAAAAGSGKTAVLVERIMHTISNEPVDIDRLLVVTFTEAAANEMRQRISAELYERQARAPEDENLQRQIMLLGRSQITTIHKFCAGVIRRYFHMIDLDPGFKIADETEVKLLKSQVLDELFERRYAEDDELFFKLADYYGGGKTKDTGLHELVLEIIEFISGLPWPQAWLERAAEMYDIADEDETLEDSLWAGTLKSDIARRLDGLEATIAYALGLAAEGAEKYIPALRSDLGIIEELRGWLNAGFSGFQESLYGVKHEELKRYSAKDVFDPEIKQRVQDIRNKEIKPGIKELQKIFIKPVDEMRRDIIELYPIQKALAGLALEFSREYGEAKRQRNIVDFGDLEQYALKVLLLPGSCDTELLLSEAAYELRERYAEVMIDEYQDSNMVQEIILSAVSSGNRFMVGDIKQSIYKFRGARPELFMEKYRTFSPSEGARRRIDLSKNFRSRECVLDAINMFFYQLMSVEAEIDYDENAALYYGADFPDTEVNVSRSAELHLIEHDGDDTEDADEPEVSKLQLEAMAVASRIKELVGGENPLCVYDRDIKAYRGSRYKDIVIILRSVRGGAAEAFLEVLKQNGIPAIADSSTGYFESVEIMTMLSFLQVTDNPKQDIPLLAVLRSPVYGLTDDQLLEIRNIRQNAVFYDCVTEYALKGTDAGILSRLGRFLGDLEQLRNEAVYLPISGLINSIYNKTDYFNYAGAMPGGAVRQANLRLLQEKAAQYETTSYKGLFNFIGYMQKIKSKISDEGEAKALSENADLVRIMTIHKSKGLEFPIAFVSLLGRRFSRQDERGNVILHESLGFGTVHIDLERRVKSNTIPRMAILKKIRQEGLAEELRVLYVAMSRAKEKLILTGSISNIAKADEKWSRYTRHRGIKLPAHAIFDANSYLDWIMPAFRRRSAQELPCDIEIFYKTAFEVLDREMAQERTEERQGTLQGLRRGYDAERVRPILWEYPLKSIAGLPAKLSISEIKRLNNRGTDSNAAAYSFAAPIYEKPKFLRESSLTAAGKGTIMHTVLEHMDMGKVNSEADLRELVSRMVVKGILSDSDTEAVDYRALAGFNSSVIMRRIIAANPRVYRETPFVMELTPYQIYRKAEFKDSGASILVHGIIDCYFEEDGGIVLVDYKTDYVKSIDRLLENYSLQIAVYKQALERATGMEVRECLLYLFGMGRAVEARLARL